MFWSRFSLTTKMFIAIALTTSTIVVVMTVMVGFGMRAGFARYLLQAELNRFDKLERALAAAHDAKRPGWPEFAAEPRSFLRFAGRNIRARRPPHHRRPPPRHRPPPPGATEAGNPGTPGAPRPRYGRPRDPLNISGRLSLLGPDKTHIAGARNNTSNAALLPIRAQDGNASKPPIGWLRLAAPRGSFQGADSLFLSGQLKTLALAALLALALSALAALLLARQFLAPLRQLAEGASKLAGGDYSARLNNQRRDELGTLIDHYNVLAENLDAAEQSQREWISNTSHELQTPLAILRAEIEALQDGVRQPTPAVLEGLHKAVMRLSLLVGDLNTLAQAREGQFALMIDDCDLVELVREVVELARPRLAAAGLAVTLGQEGPVRVACDRLRLLQLLDNVLENSRRYAETPGEVSIRIFKSGESAVLTIEDTGPAPSREQMQRLFERFYRAEASRSRQHGGSGLGLSICRAIAEAHGGDIEAAKSFLGGLGITITLPLQHCPAIESGNNDEERTDAERAATA